MDDVDGVTALPNPLPVPTKNGYTFAGWWNSDYSVQYTAGYTIYYNYTLYAKWTANYMILLITQMVECSIFKCWRGKRIS